LNKEILGAFLNNWAYIKKSQNLDVSEKKSAVGISKNGNLQNPL
jgi:hypothetical protein